MSLMLIVLALFFGLILLGAGLRLLRPARRQLPVQPRRRTVMTGIRAALD